MKKILFALALMMGAICVMGQDVYESEIQSFGDYDMKGKTFYVISANPNISNNDLEFLDYKDYITQCLILKGAILCENSDSADVCVLFDYGVVDKSYVANVAIPVWGIITTSRYINTIVTGVLNTKENIKDYRRVINLYAYDNKNRTSDPVMLWKTNIASSGISRDLQEVIPYIAYSGIQYMGKQSNGIKHRTVNHDNVNTYFIKNKYYITDNLYLVHSNKEEHDLPIEILSIFQDTEYCRINIKAKYVQGYFSYPKFKYQTYLVYKNIKHPIQAVYKPTKSHYNYLNESMTLDITNNNLIQMQFPVNLQKGDIFDIISYYNKKETKVYLHFKDIVVQ